MFRQRRASNEYRNNKGGQNLNIIAGTFQALNMWVYCTLAEQDDDYIMGGWEQKVCNKDTHHRNPMYHFVWLRR